MSRNEKLFWGTFTALIVVGFVAAVVYRVKNPTVSSNISTIGATLADPAGLPGLLTSNAPWTSNSETISERMDAISMPKLSMEGAVMHIHQQLNIFVDGANVPVPANIGIAGFFSPVHTHDTTGVVHVEAPFVAKFTLGHFFDIWGVRFTQDCIGSYCASESKPLRLYINGTLFSGDYRTVELKAHDVYALVYGTLPQSIPSTFAFPAGY